MRLLPSIFFVCPLALLAQSSGTCERPFETPFQPHGSLMMKIRSGDVDIIGTDAAKIRVTCELKKNPERAHEIQISFQRKRGDALNVDGGPMNEVWLRVEIPKRTNVHLRVPAGDVEVKNVVGDKDVEVHAGELTIDAGEPSDYNYADGSVSAGDLRAGAFGVKKGGLFRSFKKQNPGGEYRFHAHLGAGKLTIQ